MWRYMRRHHAGSWLLSLAACLGPLVLTAGCSLRANIPTKNYYLIYYQPVQKTPPWSQRPYPYALDVGRFEVERIFNNQKILYRFSPNQIQYYELERWAVRPDYMITGLIQKHLEAEGLTNRVGTVFLDSRPDFRLEGMVEALEKFDARDMFFAHLAMTFKLMRSDDGAQIWEYSFDRRKQVYQEEMVFTIKAMSEIFQTEMDIVTTSLDSLFLAMEDGWPSPSRPSEEDNVPAPADTNGSDIDESGYEIIPENR